MNPVPTNMSCAQSLPAVQRKRISSITFDDTGLRVWWKLSMLISKQDLWIPMPKALQGSEISLVGIKQTGVKDGMLLEAINCL